MLFVSVLSMPVLPFSIYYILLSFTFSLGPGSLLIKTAHFQIVELSKELFFSNLLFIFLFLAVFFIMCIFTLFHLEEISVK